MKFALASARFDLTVEPILLSVCQIGLERAIPRNVFALLVNPQSNGKKKKKRSSLSLPSSLHHPRVPARKGHHDLLPVTAETRRESARTREEEGREEPARKSPLLGCNKLADYSGKNDEIHSFSVKVNLSYHSNQVSTVSTSDIQHRTTGVPSDATQAREVFPSKGISATPSSPAFSLSLSLQA